MIKRAYALFSYAAFLASMAWFVSFLANAGFVNGVDGSAPANLAFAIVADVWLVLAFGVQHSVMARPAFKERLAHLVPSSLERSTYVLASSSMVFLILSAWQPAPMPIWTIASPVLRMVVWGVYLFGWVFVVAATFMIDHAHLFGLKQAFAGARGEAPAEPVFEKRYFYRFVRHPIMTGFLIVLWATPSMTVGHLVFAAAMTAYVFAGVHFEERDLARSLGGTYESYRRDVRGLLPIPRKLR